MINEVIKFPNNVVIVFDEKGEQLPMYQGIYAEVKVKILARAPQQAKFFHGTWGLLLVQRNDW